MGRHVLLSVLVGGGVIRGRMSVVVDGREWVAGWLDCCGETFNGRVLAAMAWWLAMRCGGNVEVLVRAAGLFLSS